jgi:hypothetical protein
VEGRDGAEEGEREKSFECTMMGYCVRDEHGTPLRRIRDLAMLGLSQ